MEQNLSLNLLIEDGVEMIVDNNMIQEYHRHRYPYILIDSLDEVEPGKSAHGYKYFSENEWLFHCNNKENQPYPFTMIIEVLTEAFLMPILMLDDNKGKITNFISCDEAHVYSDVYPGSRMDIDVEVKSWRRGMASGYAKGYIDNQLVCDAKLKFVIPEIMEQYKPKTIG